MLDRQKAKLDRQTLKNEILTKHLVEVDQSFEEDKKDYEISTEKDEEKFVETRDQIKQKILHLEFDSR